MYVRKIEHVQFVITNKHIMMYICRYVELSFHQQLLSTAAAGDVVVVVVVVLVF